jgi:hypothetical protein
LLLLALIPLSVGVDVPSFSVVPENIPTLTKKNQAMKQALFTLIAFGFGSFFLPALHAQVKLSH